VSALTQKLGTWLEHRTGLETAARSFLYEDIPASSGWHQVFGSVALFLFLVQAFTGILLAFNYAPTPGDAYNSLRYIMTQVTCGQLIRGLHHWGASMMIVVVVVHMTQVFLYGAYKKPREATWILGVILLLITLAFGLTGYLLPWDERAYWGTVVTTQIAGKAPLLGPYLGRFLGTTGSIGVVTFARFFGLHVLLLPPLATLLIVLHIYLVRRHGVAPVPGDEGPPIKFFPRQLAKDVIAVFAAFCVLYVLAIAVKAPLDRLADPTDSNYTPRPDWYFLFLFQILKVFNGSLEPVGSVGLPTLAIAALVALPFVDRKRVMRLTQRTLAFGIGSSSEPTDQCGPALHFGLAHVGHFCGTMPFRGGDDRCPWLRADVECQGQRIKQIFPLPEAPLELDLVLEVVIPVANCRDFQRIMREV